MPRKGDRPTKEDMLKAEKEIGKNIPEEMVGLDDGDIRRDPEDAGTETADDPSSRH